MGTIAMILLGVFILLALIVLVVVIRNQELSQLLKIFDITNRTLRSV